MCIQQDTIHQLKSLSADIKHAKAERNRIQQETFGRDFTSDEIEEYDEQTKIIKQSRKRIDEIIDSL